MTPTQRKRKHTRFQPVGRWIRKERRQAIYERDGFICLICERDLREALPQERTLDHVIPRASGGNNDSGNLFTACRPCNSRRGAASLRVFSLEVQRRVLRQTRLQLSVGCTARELSRTCRQNYRNHAEWWCEFCIRKCDAELQRVRGRAGSVDDKQRVRNRRSLAV